MTPNNSPLIRHLPNETFPDYTYVPKVTPHPHSVEVSSEGGESVQDVQSEWWKSRDFLRGVDLFNHGFYWESHEAWEAVWLRLGRTGIEADLIKGLIKVAAAMVKLLERSTAGRQRHAERGRVLFERVEQATGMHQFRGLDLEGLRRLAEAILEFDELPREVQVGWRVSPQCPPIVFVN